MKLGARIKKRVAAFQLDVAIEADASAIVLWGASGAGKTLTLNCLAGFSKPDSGRILLGEDLFFDAATRVHIAPQERGCGYLFQDHALFPHKTVLQNLRFASEVAHSRSRPKIKDLLEAFELGDLSNRKPAELSGGQQQRAALARALATAPRMLLLDEPTQGLDSRLKQNFYEFLKTTRKHSDALIVLVTHDLDECFELGDYLCLLDNGKLLQAGAKSSVLAKPATTEVARSLGIYNVAPAEIETLDPGRNQSRLRMLGVQCNGTYFPGHLIGDKGFVAFRESAVKLSQNSNDVALQIAAIKPYSRGIRLELEQSVSALIPERDARDLRVGDSVRIEIPAAEIVFLSK